MFMANKFRKIISLCLLIAFISVQQVVFANEIPKGTKALVQLDNSYKGKQLNIGDKLDCRLINDVKVNGRTIIPSGSRAYLFVKDAESSHFAGGGGTIIIENGAVYTKDKRYMFNFSETVKGKDKEWVKVTLCTGIILWPLLLAGFVKGGQAKIPANKIYEVEFSGYSYNY